MIGFGLQFGHGLGLALHERPIISRVVSMDHPTEIKEGMVFAIETYCPATDGFSAARIEEEVVVTDKGCRVISLFPAEELPIATGIDEVGPPALWRPVLDPSSNRANIASIRAGRPRTPGGGRNLGRFRAAKRPRRTSVQCNISSVAVLLQGAPVARSPEKRT